MKFFISTTFHGTAATNLDLVLGKIDGLNIDGIELGSTHLYHPDIASIVNKKWKKDKVTHNFFPPSINPNFVMNIASDDDYVRHQSIAHATFCIEFAANIGASVYTIHPGFSATAGIGREDEKNYDFSFTKEKIDRGAAFYNMKTSLVALIEIAKKNGIKLAVETEGSLTKPGVLLMEKMEEFDELFSMFSEDLYLNLNLAHTRFASIDHQFNMSDFISRYYEKIVLIEISHNNGEVDQHLPLTDDSYIFNYLPLLPDVPHILEFRNSTVSQINNSINLISNFSTERL